MMRLLFGSKGRFAGVLGTHPSESKFLSSSHSPRLALVGGGVVAAVELLILGEYVFGVASAVGTPTRF